MCSPQMPLKISAELELLSLTVGEDQSYTHHPQGGADVSRDGIDLSLSESHLTLQTMMLHVAIATYLIYFNIRM